MKEPGKYIARKGNGKRYAIGDIHGCFKTFEALVETKIKFSKQDQLFLLGDYLHRGPLATKVVDYIINKRNEGYQIYPLRGNHEQMMLERKGEQLVEPYKGFFENLLYYYDTDDFYIVHAGLNFNAYNPLEDKYSMLWQRDLPTIDFDFLGKRKVIHGHTIHTLDDIVEAVDRDATILPLDNGCYRGLNGVKSEYGKLCALDLDLLKLIIQDNLDEN